MGQNPIIKIDIDSDFESVKYWIDYYQKKLDDDTLFFLETKLRNSKKSQYFLILRNNSSKYSEIPLSTDKIIGLVDILQTIVDNTSLMVCKSKDYEEELLKQVYEDMKFGFFPGGPEFQDIIHSSEQPDAQNAKPNNITSERKVEIENQNFHKRTYDDYLISLYEQGFSFSVIADKINAKHRSLPDSQKLTAGALSNRMSQLRKAYPDRSIPHRKENQ